MAASIRNENSNVHKIGDIFICQKELFLSISHRNDISEISLLVGHIE